jgi:hypothetical protein
MIKFSDEVMNVLKSLSTTVDMREHKTELDMMVNTNWKHENKRKGSRSFDVVKENTARGLGAEIALQQTELFEQSSPITENAAGLSFAQRKKDVKCEGLSGEVKTMNGKYPWWYISSAQCESVMYSTRFNDFFLILAVESVKPLVYQYRPKFLVDSKSLSRYIIKNTGGFSEYKFDHPKAIAKGDCIDLWSA